MTINGIDRKSLPAGIYVPVVTFFKATAEQELDIDTHVRHITMLAEAGVDGVVLQGSTGEAVALTREERVQLVHTAKDAFSRAGNSGRIIAGTVGAQSTAENVMMCKEAASAGADFALVLPPSYYPSLMTDDAIKAFYEDVANASPIPIIIYSYPGVCSGINMSSDVIIQVGHHPNVAGVKHTDHDLGKMARESQIQFATPFAILGGATDYLLGSLVLGGQGSITGMGNVAPRVCCKALQLAANGNHAEAQKYAGIISNAEVSLGRGAVVGTKYATVLANSYPQSALACRKPIPDVSPATKADVEARCEQVIFLEKRLREEGFTGSGLKGQSV